MPRALPSQEFLKDFCQKSWFYGTFLLPLWGPLPAPPPPTGPPASAPQAELASVPGGRRGRAGEPLRGWLAFWASAGWLLKLSPGFRLDSGLDFGFRLDSAFIH